MNHEHLQEKKPPVQLSKLKLKRLRTKHAKLIHRITKQNPERVTSYQTPCCDREQKTIRPIGDQQPLETFCQCLICGALYFKVVTHTDIITTVDAPYEDDDFMDKYAESRKQYENDD